MSNELRVRAIGVGGLVEDAPLASGGTTLTSAGLAGLPVVDSTNHAAIVLDPDGVDGAPEIVWVTAHTAAATTATIARGKEGTTGRAHAQDTPWVHSPTPWDYSPALTKAGTVSDADFAHAPPDGTQAIDTTNNRLYVRVAGAWKYAGLT